jgi:hypothetical protein
LVLGLVVLLAVLWFVFLRGGPEEVVEVAPPVTAPTIEPAPEETEAPNKGKRPIETFEVFAPKDPFRPLISDSAATSGTGATTSGSVAAPAGTPGTGTGTAQPSGGSDIGGSSGSGSGDSSVGGHRVRLIDTFQAGGRARARVQVDGTVYTVDEGDRFADNFELLSINGDCASMLFGDDQFSLCEGEEILK